MMKRKPKKQVEEIIAVPKADRRILSNVPDPENIRTGQDRREGLKGYSLRYLADFPVSIYEKGKKARTLKKAVAKDISLTGMFIALDSAEAGIKEGKTYSIQFQIPPGTLPEGFESTVKITGQVVRVIPAAVQEGGAEEKAAIRFERDLFSYFQKKRWNYSVYSASTLLFFAVLIIMLMRVESILYFKYNVWLYLYSLVAAIFLLTRYLFGSFYRNVPINPDFTPGVSIIIPCFNEENWIHRTILSCINQDYPVDRLEVIVVDDHSADKSVESIQRTVSLLNEEGEAYQIKNRIKVIPMQENGGKRLALMKGIAIAKHDLVVFVDSDSFLEPMAIKHLVQPFQDPKMGGVTGRTDVENKYTNTITKLQTVRYYIAFRIMKAAESYFDSVTCLSGPLSCYRKDLIILHGENWLNQRFLGQPATFGDDRSMTNFILQTHRTSYQDNAICSTIVPSDLNIFLKQQMRWKRSWLRESLRAGGFIWKKEPFMALFFYIGLIVPIAAPVVVLYNLIYVPLAYDVFPTTFLIGLLLMALLMSFAHLLFKKSKLWVFGLIFCIFYELVLLWQMPVAWVTFWKSTWGTRETPQDIEAKSKKEARKKRRQR